MAAAVVEGEESVKEREDEVEAGMERWGMVEGWWWW